ncbi:DUF6973 domain-containing protein [Rubellicoccus peritrichatus]|uniref:RHS repeat-associated core domain-containing protein n=1 Tax=Rubellicoccus peritrichatus TaxID=3080537 RepID=A0AAQ3QWS9_9BACT|nr:RHS repeat-associated core domain-containing protein [Puniceicoccus sp. CR14]WOO42197.1 RHS repeat-associated core domain-containing protein [Puniceicoccus sp. CR14]
MNRYAVIKFLVFTSLALVSVGLHAKKKERITRAEIHAKCAEMERGPLARFEQDTVTASERKTKLQAVEQTVRNRSAYGDRITLRALDLTKIPCEKELRMCGQLGSPLSPTGNAEPLKIRDPKKRKKQAEDNWLFGYAMENWNKHDYKDAVEIFKEHRKEFGDDSPWAGESELHMGCEAQFNGRWGEAEQCFQWILDNTEVGSDIYQKAKLRLSVMYLEKGEIQTGIDSFAQMLETETSWERRTYAQSWMRQMSLYKGHLASIRNCGNKCLAEVLEMQGDTEKAKRLRLEPASGEFGFSLGELAAVAVEEGLPARAVYADLNQIGDMPLPFIAHYGDKHYVVVREQLSDGNLSVYDNRLEQLVIMSEAELAEQWSGLAVVFEDNGTVFRDPTADELMQMGGCCGLPRPEEDLGNDCDQPSGCARGKPVWSVNPINMNFYIQDVPMWYETERGPDIEIWINYNSQDSLNSLRPVGNKWTLNYASYMMQGPNGEITLVMPNGRRDVWQENNSGGTVTYTAPAERESSTLKLAPGTQNFYNLTLGDGNTYYYSIPTGMPAGENLLLTRITDPEGQSVFIDHDANGNITKVRDALSREWDFDYNANGYLETVSDPFGRTCTFGYTIALDGQSYNLTSQTDMGGISYGYDYDQNSALAYSLSALTVSGYVHDELGNPLSGVNIVSGVSGSAVTDSNGMYTVYGGFPQRFLTAEKAGYGSITAPLDSVDGDNGTLDFILTLGAPDETLVDSLESVYVSEITMPAGTTQIYIEPADGIINGMNPYPDYGADMWENYRITVTDPLEGVQEYYFNGFSNYAWYRDQNQMLSTLPWDTAPKTRFDFEIVSGNKGAISKVTYANDDYEEFSNFTSSMQPQTVRDARGETHTYTYNDQGSVLTYKNPRGYTTTYDYTSNGVDLWKVTNHEGVIEMELDYTGDLLAASGSSGTSGTASVAVGSKLLGIKDAEGNLTKFYYDVNNMLSSVVNAKLETTTFVRNDPTYPYRISSIEQGGITLREFGYDDAGRVTSQTDTVGPLATGGTVEHHTRIMAYDGLNRLTRVDYPDGTYESWNWTCCNLDYSRDRNGNQTDFYYDANQRMIARKDAQGRVTHFGYEPNGNLETLHDAEGNLTRWVYDPRNRPEFKIYADDKQVQYAYDGNGNVTDFTNARGQTIKYVFDANGNLDAMHLDGNTASIDTAAGDVDYTYDTLDRMDTMIDRFGTTVFTYDDNNRVDTVDGPWASDLIDYDYDELGRSLGRSINSVAASVVYDSLGRIDSMTNTLGTFDYQYTGTPGLLDKVVYPNQQETEYSWYGETGDFRLQQIKNIDKLGGMLSQFDYSYDPAGNIIDWRRQLGGNPATNTNYGYDKAYQLLSAVEKAVSNGTVVSSESWRYDRVGNRTFAQDGMSSQASAYNDLNQLTGSEGGPTLFSGTLDEPANVTVGGTTARLLPDGAFEAELELAPGTHDVDIVATDGSGNTASDTYQVTVPIIAAQTYLYDDDGNLVADLEKTYEWDALNRLTAINYVGTTLRSEFEYDGLSRRSRIIEKDNGVEQSNHIYLWSDSSIVEKRDSTGATVLRQYFGNGFTEGANDYFYTKDHLGSIREVVADNGSTVESKYEYTPWGEAIKIGGTGVESDFLYTGHYYHAEGNLFLTWFRAYDPGLGRWLSRDPLGFVDGPNIYAYVGNNPIRFIDPFGLSRRMPEGKCKARNKIPSYWDYFRGWRSANYATETAARRFSSINQHNTRADAFRHALWTADMTRIMGPERASRIADGHENTINNHPREKSMDLHNNDVGRQIAEENPGLDRNELEQKVYEAACDGRLQDTP